MNILVTAIGSMSAECVVDSLNNLGVKVVATDIYPKEYHPIARKCKDFVQVPKVFPNVDSYCQSILTAAIKNKCEAIIPLTDPEVDVLSDQRHLFSAAGIEVWLASDATIKCAREKDSWTARLSNSQSFKMIPTFDNFSSLCRNYAGDFVAKRVNGRSSEGILFSDTVNFKGDIRYGKGYLFQPLLVGDIITVDFARHPLSGQVVLVPRVELMRTKNGAGTVVRILSPDDYKSPIEELVESLELTGVMNCEFIQNNEGLFLMDINPRFSAGVSFSRMAGYDFIKANMQCYSSKLISEAAGIVEGQIFVKRFCDY